MSHNTDSNNTFVKNNKNLLIALVSIIVLVILAVALTRMNRASRAPAPEPEAVEATEVAPAAEVTAVTAGEAAYKSAIASYEGKTITVTDTCVATPAAQTFTMGDTALLVNASNTAHAFTVGTETYNVGERHYKTLRLVTAGTMTVSCDDIKDIATITVE